MEERILGHLNDITVGGLSSELGLMVSHVEAGDREGRSRVNITVMVELARVAQLVGTERGEGGSRLGESISVSAKDKGANHGLSRSRRGQGQNGQCSINRELHYKFFPSSSNQPICLTEIKPERKKKRVKNKANRLLFIIGTRAPVPDARKLVSAISITANYLNKRANGYGCRLRV